MRPDRTNYELWLIDYLDGNLDKDRVEQLMIFLDENPDLKEELTDLISYRIKPVEGSFTNKGSLKKTISEISDSQFELLCVASAEGDLSENQAAELKEIIASDPGKKKTFELTGKLKLTPPVVEFSHKNRLRRLTLTQKVIRYSVIGLSAAASVVVALSVVNQKGLDKPRQVNIAVHDSVNPQSTTVTPGKPELKELPAERPLTKTLISENINSALQNAAAADKKLFPVNLTADTSIKNLPIERINIASVDFNRKVVLENRNPGKNLISMNVKEINIIEEPTTRFNGLIASFFRERIFKSDNTAHGNLKAYEIADAGISGLNKLLGWQMSLKENKDVKGEVNSVNFNSKLLKFSTPVKKVQPLP